MGPDNLKWIQYHFLDKCVRFEAFYKVGPITCIKNKNLFLIVKKFYKKAKSMSYIIRYH